MQVVCFACWNEVNKNDSVRLYAIMLIVINDIIKYIFSSICNCVMHDCAVGLGVINVTIKLEPCTTRLIFD